MTFTEQHLKITNRTKKGMFLLFADLDNMKWINDTLGHREGDMALIATSSILKETFRDSDIVSRIGGDEFAVLAIEAQKNSEEVIVSRLIDNFEAYNIKENRNYNLSVSIGIAHYDVENPATIDELLAQADVLMYENKRKKKEALNGNIIVLSK
jgi:diguanylate cyclase (GGDEF)-like protein